jgi:hypothetical protein
MWDDWWIMKRNGIGRKQSSPDRNVVAIWTEKLWKTSKNISQDDCSPDRRICRHAFASTHWQYCRSRPFVPKQLTQLHTYDSTLHAFLRLQQTFIWRWLPYDDGLQVILLLITEHSADRRELQSCHKYQPVLRKLSPYKALSLPLFFPFTYRLLLVIIFFLIYFFIHRSSPPLSVIACSIW